MPKKIILVRHGQTNENTQRVIQGHLDTLLNAEGLKQAITAADKLKTEEIDEILSSDLRRAYDTAQIIAKKLNKKIVKEPLLRERDFGQFQGMSVFTIRKQYQKFTSENNWFEDDFNDSVSKMVFIESNQKMLCRFQKLFQKLQKKYSGKNILLVTHGGSIRMFLKVLNLDQELLNRVTIKNTSLTIIVKNKKHYFLHHTSEVLQI